jgi:cytoskeletal protein RodZ
MSSAQNKAVVAVIGVAVLAGLGWLAFGYFGIQAAFTNSEVDEAAPTFGSDGSDASTADASTADASTAETGPSEDADNPGELQSALAEAAESPTEVDEETMPGEVATLVSGEFSGSTGHEVTGQALVLNDGSEQRFLRFEGFESTNGPDLNVYLRADDGEYVDLGDLKGNIGDQNYEIPADVDLARFNTVQVWCVRFSVLFGDALLA